MEVNIIEKAPCSYYLRAIFYSWERHTDKTYAEDNLNTSQQSILFLLNEHPEQDMTLREVERILNFSQTGTAKLTTQLQNGGWVRKYIDMNDKRVKRIALLEKGKTFCRKSEQKMLNAEAMLLDGMDEKEREKFQSYLSIAYHNALKMENGEKFA
jgi:DNA-binding MarR family transcriptional regulator